MKKLFILFTIHICFSVFAQDQKGLLIENFSSNKLNWPVASDASAKWKVENGLYYRENLKNFAYSTLKPVELDPLGDYWILLDAKHLDGVTNQGYGLSFGALDKDNEFAFVIANSGHYQIYKRENGKITEIVKWTETDAIYKSGNMTNSFYLIKHGNDWKFKINAKFVYSMPVQPLFGYNFGVTSSGMQTVAFDALNVNQIMERSTPPIRTIVKDTLLLKEDFSNNTRRWAEYSDDAGTTAIKDGKYRFDHKASGVDFSIYRLFIDEYQDYSISVNSSVYASGDSSEYGMCLGFKDVKNYYSFYLTSDGMFGIYRSQNGEFKEYMGLTPSSAIKREEKAVNILTMRQEEKSWKFFINDQSVASLPAQSFYGDRVGVLAGGKQGVEFDDLIVKQINVTRFYRTKLCLIQKGVLKEIDAEEAPYEITAVIDGKKQTFRRYAPPDFPGYAAKQSWFTNSDPIRFKGMNFKKSGPAKTISGNELKKIGDYETVGVYIEKKSSLDSSAIIYVPVRIGCEWQPYSIQCPSFELNVPAMAPIGDTITFTADVTDVKISKYTWTVSDGKIIKGQGTRSIQVSTEGLVNRSILDVSVEVNPRSPGCENKKSKTVRVGSRPTQGRPQRTRN